METRNVVKCLVWVLGLACSLWMFTANAQGPLETSSVHETDILPQELEYAYSMLNQGEYGLLVGMITERGIWWVNPATTVYTSYQTTESVYEAAWDTAGNIWWVGGKSHRLGRLVPPSTTASLWTLPGEGNPSDMAIDSNNEIWAVDQGKPMLFQVKIASNQVCTYTIPDNEGNKLLLIEDDDDLLWTVGSYSYNDHLLKFDPANNRVTRWQLPPNNPDIVDLALADDNNVCWVDAKTSSPNVGRLDLSTNTVTTYTAPIDIIPVAIISGTNGMWLTSLMSNTLSLLDPDVAVGYATPVFPTTFIVTPTCVSLGLATNQPLVTDSDAIVFTSNSITRTVNSNGWEIYRFPPDRYPVDLTLYEGSLWITAMSLSGNTRLLSFFYPLYLPVIFKS